MDLREDRRKRDFERTPEPRGDRPPPREPKGAERARRFVVQKHAARSLHYDLRLELGGVLKSWAVPKGPSLAPGERRMAAQTEDHPIEYETFEGVIPLGEYGGGAVVVWDRGHWQPIGDPHAGLERGNLEFRLEGHKLRGRFRLVRIRPRAGDRGRPSWLLIKARDEEARPAGAPPITDAEPRSVLSGRDLAEVARDADRVWPSEHGEADGRPIGATDDPAGVPGARRAPCPENVEPELATLVEKPPSGDAFLHEIKLDGYRLIVRFERGTVRLSTRGGHDWTARFPGLAAAFRALPAKTAIVDGEAVIVDAHGRTSFQALQGALGRDRPDLSFYAFDLLYLDGWDLRGAALVDRKRVLRQLLARLPPGSAIRYSDHVRGGGEAFFAEACRAGVEGIVSKRADAPHHPGRSRAWLKVKCQSAQELVIVGFTEPKGSRVALGALLLGAHDERGQLRYCGKVGTGFSGEELARLRARLAPLERKEPPVVNAPRRRGVHWVAPKLVAHVKFSEWTKDGKVRHPSYVALRDDKPASEVRIEKVQKAETPEVPAAPRASASRSAKRARAEVAGVWLSTPGRVYFPDLGITKQELAEYYETVAERMLPAIAYRPLTLLRCPEGREGHCFYQKRARAAVPEVVPRVVVKEGREPYVMVDGLRALVALVQIGVLELHVWGARADRLDRPDLLIFDLDPDEAVPWSRVVETALAVRARLEELGLVPFARVTGGKGLHVVAPLVRRSTWAEVKAFARAVARGLARQAPERLTATMSKRKRHGKVFLDYLRNAPEATSIAAYSVRARPGAPVALPLAWDELDGERPVFAMRDVARWLARPDPWAELERSRRPITAAAMRRAGGE